MELRAKMIVAEQAMLIWNDIPERSENHHLLNILVHVN